MKIAILSHVGIETGGPNFLYPLFLWKKLLRENGVEYTIFRDHNDAGILKYPVVIVIHRYFHQLLGDTHIRDKSVIINFLEKLRMNGSKVIYFDAGDSTGSRDFDLIQYSDIFWKKQVLRDRSIYTVNRGEASVRVWVNTPDIGTDIYTPCPSDQLLKIRAAWHIGLADYRNWHPRLGQISNRWTGFPTPLSPGGNRPYTTVFRGTMGKNPVYAGQRNAILQQLQRMDGKDSIIGGKVGKKQYLNEVRQSKILISPFGWGEICYRDFEAFISGNILLKPSVEHLEGYPTELFIPNQTYVPLLWSLEDFQQQLDQISSNYKRYVEIAQNGQQRFMNSIQNGDAFVQHFLQILS